MMGSQERFEKKQRKERFLARQTEAFQEGYYDCGRYRSLARFDTTDNEYDHQFNPYVTRSASWDEYRSGCRHYYDENK